MAERHLQVYCEKWATDQQIFWRRCLWNGRRGAPDDLFVVNGRHIWVEFKQPGEMPRALQNLEHARMRKAGMEVHVIDNFRDFKKLFSECLKLTSH